MGLVGASTLTLVCGGCCSTDMNGPFCLWARSVAEAVHDRQMKCCVGSPPLLDPDCDSCIDDLLARVTVGTPGVEEFIPDSNPPVPNPAFFPSLSQVLQACEDHQDERLKRYFDIAIGGLRACGIAVPGTPLPSATTQSGLPGTAMVNPTPLLTADELVTMHCVPIRLRPSVVALAQVDADVITLPELSGRLTATGGPTVVVTGQLSVPTERYSLPALTPILLGIGSSTQAARCSGAISLARLGGPSTIGNAGIVVAFTLAINYDSGWTVVLDLDPSCPLNRYGATEVGALVECRVITPFGVDISEPLDLKYWVRIPIAFDAGGVLVSLGSQQPIAGDFLMPPSSASLEALAEWNAAAQVQAAETSGCDGHLVSTPAGGTVDCLAEENACAVIPHPFNPAGRSTCAARARVCKIRYLLNGNCFHAP